MNVTIRPAHLQSFVTTSRGDTVLRTYPCVISSNGRACYGDGASLSGTRGFGEEREVDISGTSIIVPF